ncbi:alpha/beta fold hydrolase [Paenibacillus sepulcri]|uniref:Alpha/beta hydrolase n=1 Tax=Paenibacillus sepulcri TaxID=359917 RepID=A0ABS7CB21_9BACL|nr:alpha/beta hydrolase [Paenibacillus sepulcri]
MITQKAYTIGCITSKDGTTIGYRQLGRGPGLVIMHGGLQAAQNFMLLATALSDEFTVYLPDRRGRGLSGPPGENYSIRKECEDLDALLRKTGAHYVFGLSSGAVISLYSALNLPAIHKVALFEPPLSITSVLNKFVPRYEQEIAEGKLVSAFITIIKGLGISPILNIIPRFILLPLLKLTARSKSNEPKGDVPLKELIPTFHYDNLLIRETEETFKTFKNVRAKSLIMGGSKSPGYFKIVIKKLSAVIPRVKSMEFPGLDHSGPDDGGKPAIVAEVLRSFFNESDLEE